MIGGLPWEKRPPQKAAATNAPDMMRRRCVLVMGGFGGYGAGGGA